MSDLNDDPSKFVFRSEIKAKTFENAARALSNGNGAVFDPMESIAAGIRAGNAIIQIIRVCALLLARGIIAPVEIVLRRNFGERYFNGLVTLMVLVVLYFFSWCSYNGESFSFVIGLVYVGCLLWNYWKCYERDRKKGYWHSYSEGVSRIRVKKWDAFFASRNFTFDVSTLFLEPAVVIIVGLLCYLVLPGLWILEIFRMNPIALYLIVAGVVLFFYQLYCYQYRRNRLLDEKDNRIVAETYGILNTPNYNPGVGTHGGISYVVTDPNKKTVDPANDSPKSE